MKKNIIGLLLILTLVPAGYVVAQDVDIDALKNEIESVKKELEAKKNAADQLDKESDQYEKEIEVKQKEQSTLKNQLEVIAAQLSSARVSVEKTKNSISQTTLEIQKLELQLTEIDAQKKERQSLLRQLLRELNKVESRDQMSSLIVHNSLSEYFEQATAVAEVQKSMAEALSEVQRLEKETSLTKEYAEQRKKSLENLTSKLVQQQRSLEEQESVKTLVLEQTEQSEEKFQQLLSRVREEQTAVSAQVQQLETAARQKLQQLQDKLPADQKDDALAVGDGTVSWPLNGYRRVTAYFHDPKYPFKNVFQHPAIDIACPQGTPVLAVADGVVGVARNIGWITTSSKRYPAYNYVLIAHSDFSSVYGHLSKVYVSEGQLVRRGDVIGLSGATPGTEGAGLLTTGPHLHLEIRQNGIPVDPLGYLP